jgi:diadenosine tetraphosphate (Ap4A) HIT family hydrolase
MSAAADVRAFERMLRDQGAEVPISGGKFKFEHWSLFLDIKQYYVGRCFAWANRLDANEFTDLSEAELLEFRQLAALYKEAMGTLIPVSDGSLNSDGTETRLSPPVGRAPELLNISFLGNEMFHCHAHLVPRYSEAPILPFSTGMAQERDFTDEFFGKNWSQPPRTSQRNSLKTDDAEDLALYVAVRDRLSEALTVAVAARDQSLVAAAESQGKRSAGEMDAGGDGDIQQQADSSQPLSKYARRMPPESSWQDDRGIEEALQVYNEAAHSRVGRQGPIKAPNRQVPCEECDFSAWSVGEYKFIAEHHGNRTHLCRECMFKRLRNIDEPNSDDWTDDDRY